MFGNGDGWVRCAARHRHWGLHGAAGLLLVARAEDTTYALLQHRAWWSHHGGTWGVPGGARGRDESVHEAALREVGEEVAIDLGCARLLASYVDDHGGWSYTTVLASAPTLLAVAPRGTESEDIRWVAFDDLPTLPLHPGFAQTWPHLQPLLADVEPVSDQR